VVNYDYPKAYKLAQHDIYLSHMQVSRPSLTG